MYACINVQTKLMYFQQILYPQHNMGSIIIIVMVWLILNLLQTLTLNLNPTLKSIKIYIFPTQILPSTHYWYYGQLHVGAANDTVLPLASEFNASLFCQVFFSNVSDFIL